MAKAYWFAHQLAQVHLTGQQTDGAVGVVEVTSTAGPAAPLHVHADDDEAFYILEGEVTFHIGARVERASTGSMVLAPKRVPHTLTVDSPTARWLVLSTPAGFERFVERLGVPASALELPSEPHDVDPEAVAAAAAEHGIEILGPPGALPG